MNKVDILAITILFIVAFSLWTLPIQNDPRPFGEGDAAWHFSIGDYISSTDNPIFRLPFYVGQWYYGYNPALGINAPEYPPPNHYNYALMQVSGGERFTPVMMYRAIASFLGIFAVYFTISKLFGTASAIIASTGLVFSLREYMIYLWGQQPTLVSVVIAPITFYAFYRYLDSYYDSKPNPAYLYSTALLLASQFLLHIQGFTFSVLVLGSFTVLMIFKHRSLPFLKESKKQLVIVAALFLVLALPFIMIYLGTPQLGNQAPDFSRIFSWGVDHSLVAGSYPPAFTSFDSEYPKLLIPFLFLGIGFALIRRRTKDLLMLGWLAGLYLVLHTDLYLGTGPERSARMLIAEPALFYSFIGLGALAPLSFIKLPKNILSIIKISITAIFVVLIVQTNGSVAEETLSASYQSIFRITPPQSELADWINAETADDAVLYYIPESSPYKLGSWQYAKLRWILASSQRHVASFRGTIKPTPEAENSDHYFIFDYSDLAAILNSPPNPLQAAAQQSAAAVQQFESENFNASEALYDINNIRVYEIEIKNFK